MKVQFTILLFTISLIAVSQTTDANGKKQGYWKKKDENTGKLIYEGEFKDNLPIGKFKYYYPHDTVKAIMYFKLGGKIAYSTLFHPNGKKMGIGKYISEAKDSTWLYYDEGGVLISKDKYVMGKKDGLCYVYTPDGALAEEKTFKADIQDGPYKQYFDGKKVRAQGTYKNGELDGKASYFYPNGIEVATGFYVNGKKNGPWIYKNEKGGVKEKELYKNGVQCTKKETDEFFSKNKIKPETTEKPEPKKGAGKGTKK